MLTLTHGLPAFPLLYIGWTRGRDLSDDDRGSPTGSTSGSAHSAVTHHTKLVKQVVGDGELECVDLCECVW